MPTDPNLPNERVHVDLAASILQLDRTIRKQNEIHSELVGLVKDQLKASGAALKEAEAGRMEAKAGREEIASLTNELVLMRADIADLRSTMGLERRARDRRDSNGGG